MQTDLAAVILAMVALINAIGSSVAVILTAWGHVQRPRSSSVNVNGASRGQGVSQ